MLKSALGGAVLFAHSPWARVWAQGQDGALKLLKAPKVALVVGNSKYKDAPALKNPANDAAAIAAQLKASGFATTVKLDTGKEELIQAIRDYVHAMEKQQAVGLFYFAGHGVQLDWRNYMLPVDAVIDKIEDVAAQSVEIARLMEGLTKAKNPMNVIILDACRENPFGETKKPAQRGLSQMDAPNQTFLAYATSPGNVASDGYGAHGLYTEQLLKEMKVPEAKIEEIFKRVRLGVRLKSRGAQVPWESTSLEDDFWFQPPAQLKKISDAERDRAYAEERAAWDKAKGATEPGPLEAFLRRYPSGNFSELAQLRLDQVLAKLGEKKVEVVRVAANPFSKGTAEFSTDWKVGDNYTYRIQDIVSGADRGTESHTIVAIEGGRVRYDSGLVTDLLGNTLRNPGGAELPDNQNVPLEFSIGKRWVTRVDINNPRVGIATTITEFHIVGRELVTVGAGQFNAFRVEQSVWSTTGITGAIQGKGTTWFDPEKVRRPVKLISFAQWRGQYVAHMTARRELVSFKQA